MDIESKNKISRKQFLMLLGGSAVAFAAGRLASVVGGPVSDIDFIKDVDRLGYGKAAYGGDPGAETKPRFRIPGLS